MFADCQSGTTLLCCLPPRKSWSRWESLGTWCRLMPSTTRLSAEGLPSSSAVGRSLITCILFDSLHRRSQLLFCNRAVAGTGMRLMQEEMLPLYCIPCHSLPFRADTSVSHVVYQGLPLNRHTSIIRFFVYIISIRLNNVYYRPQRDVHHLAARG